MPPPAKRKLEPVKSGNMDISAMFKKQVTAKARSPAEQHCEMPGCPDEVWAACNVGPCLDLLCYEHFNGNLSIAHQLICKGRGCAAVQEPVIAAVPPEDEKSSTVVSSSSVDSGHVMDSHCSKIDISDDLDLGTEFPAQPRLHSFPGTVYGKKNKITRRFQPSWYSRPWLEYSITADRCFCFACRQFGDVNVRDQDPAFVKIGFSNWKTALQANKGFSQHEQSKVHRDAMTKWAEFQHRLSAGKTIDMQLCGQQLLRNRYYVRSIAEIVTFLAVNELAFRGDQEQIRAACSDQIDEVGDLDGLFLRLFEFTMQKDEKLKTIAASIPKHAKYTSPEIQNEIISTLAGMVQGKITEQLAKSDIGLFCLKCDETRDASNVENMSVCLRFVVDGKPVEHLLSIVALQAVDAKSITAEILNELRAQNIDPNNMISQCYDGASVMSGCMGGVQKLISDELKRTVPYVHCFNHRLHLVVVHSMNRVSQVKQFFSICEQLYVFFRRQFLSSAYQGHKLKRVLEQRWTGHLESAKVIMENRSEIIEALEEASNACLDFSVAAAGLKAHVSKPDFSFIAAVVVKVLTVLQPPNAMLQAKTVNMCHAVDMIQSSVHMLEELRSDDTFSSLANDAGICPLETSADSQQTDSENGSKKSRVRRTSCPSKALDGYFVLSSTGNRSEDHDPSVVRLKRVYFSLLDNVINELNSRFASSNASLSLAVSALLPDSDNFFKVDDLSPLTALMQHHRKFDEDSLEAELMLARNLLTKLDACKHDLQKTAMSILPYREAFPALYWHYAAALTIGVSTATCENTFSCLTRILKPSRVSMCHNRKCQLVLLAFEKKLTQTLDLDEFVRIFSSQSRRLQL